jgi:hypothetical protein
LDLACVDRKEEQSSREPERGEERSSAVQEGGGSRAVLDQTMPSIIKKFRRPRRGGRKEQGTWRSEAKRRLKGG